MTIDHMRTRVHQRRSRAELTAFLATLVLFGSPACEDASRNKPGPDAARDSGDVTVNDGTWLANSHMSESERTQFLHLSQGSELFPVDWLLALRTSSGEKFLQLDRPGYGLLAGEIDGELNPRGLPVGMSSAPPEVADLEQVQMFGFNCAACHVAEIRKGERPYRILGAPNLFDIDSFQLGLSRNLSETMLDPSRRDQFIRELEAMESKTLAPEPVSATSPPPSDPSAALAAFLQNFRAPVRAYVAPRFAPGPKIQRTDAGFGRVDAFGSAHNRLFTKDTPWDLTAPVDFPRIWNVQHMHTYHWDGNDTSIVLRNVGEAIGLGATVDPETHESSVRLASLERLEELAQKIEPPRWPFEAPDSALQARGQRVFAEHCNSCHDSESGKRAEVGTDAHRIDSFSRKLQSGEPFAQALEASLIAIIDKACANADRAKLGDDCSPKPNSWSTQQQYIGRTLAGVWATAPYLHNGSVPTLAALLERDRPAQFAVGSRTFDRENVGYVEGTAEPARVRDTSQPGNGNQGHLYGVDLPAADKRALIEFIKTIH